jgi:crotonobetainyl-CoA:carnitine CoA-transferase CaiB-like acyl-CoA transferase
MHAVLRSENPMREGNTSPVYAPHNVYPCSGDDRWVAIAVTNDDEWSALCEALGDEELRADAALRSGLVRLQQRDRIDEHIRLWTQTQTPQQVTRILQAAGVPAGTVAQNYDLFADEHLADREFFEEVTHPVAGTHLYPGAGWKMSATSQRTRMPAPLLGEHNDYVLREVLGLADVELVDLTRRNVIGRKPTTEEVIPT